MASHSERKDYLVGRMIFGARLVSDYFDELLSDPAAEPEYLARYAMSKYDLTSSQKQELTEITERVSAARMIVTHLVEKHRTARSGSIKDKTGLYKLIFNEEPPQRKFWAKPYSFAIGFYLPKECFVEKQKKRAEERTCGDAFYGPTEALFYINNTKAIWERTGCFESLESLAFRVNYEILNPQNPVTRMIVSAIGNYEQRNTEQHELKHLIDNFFMNQKLETIELSADLFEGSLRGDVRYHDYSKLKDAKKEAKDAAEKKKLGDRIRRIKGFPLELLDSITSKGLDCKTLSYIVAMTHFSKLEHRLRLIDDYLARNPASQFF